MAHNHPGKGIEYEVLVPALYALQLCYSEDVIDYEMETNVRNFGNMDDLLLTIKLKDNTERRFALQLKHKEVENKTLEGKWLEGETGDFSLPKYCKAYHDVKYKDKRKYNFILFTNININENHLNVTNFSTRHYNQFSGEDFCYLLKEKLAEPHIYKFEINEQTAAYFRKTVTKNVWTDFLSRFSLYVNQLNASEMEQRLEGLFLKRLCASQGQTHSYLKFFRDWHKGQFSNTKLTMHTVKCIIFDILLTPHIMEMSIINRCDNMKNILLQKAIEQFDVTVCKNLENHISGKLKFVRIDTYDEQKFCKTARDHKLLSRKDKIVEMNEGQKQNLKNRIFWFVEHEPIMIRFTPKSRNALNQIIEFANGSLKFLLMTENADEDEHQFPKLKVFRNLYDLKVVDFPLFEEITKVTQISLQGRQPISLQDLQTILEDDEVTKSLTLNFLLKSEMIHVGESKEDLLDYIPRQLQKAVINTSAIDNVPNDSFIIECGNHYDKIKENNFIKRKKEVEEENEFISDRSFQISNNMVLIGKQYTIEYFRKIELDDATNLHYLRAINSEDLEWIATRRSVNNLRSCDFKRLSNKDSKIYDHLDNNIHLLCSIPGMGKSTIFKFLKNTASPDFWTTKIDINHSQLFEETRNAIQVVEKCLQNNSSDNLAKAVVSAFRAKRNLMWFFDGMDELGPKLLANIIETIKYLVSEGHVIWVSSRYNLQKKLEDAFCVLSVDLEPVSQESQEMYLEKRLSNKYETEAIKDIKDKIYRGVITNSNRNLFNIPLLLFMLTEIVLLEGFTQDIFVLTKIYHKFILGKFKRFLRKVEVTHLFSYDTIFENRIKTFQKLALKVCLEKNLYQSLNLRDDVYNEKLGIISHISNDGTAIFVHHTFAEYLAALWLTTNIEAIDSSDRKFLFEGRYDNIRFFFDMILSEGNPVVLAVLNKDLKLLKFLGNSADFNRRDHYGRDVLQICCSYGYKYYPVVPVHDMIVPKHNEEELQVKPSQTDAEHQNMLEYLLQHHQLKPLEKDALFGWDAFQYADASLSLHALELLVQKYECDFSRMTNYANIFTVVAYAVCLGFGSLLKLAAQRGDFRKIVNRRYGNFRMDGSTMLHVAARNGRREVVKILLENGADVNLADEEMRKPAIAAIERGHLEIVKLFEEVNGISIPMATALNRVDIIKRRLAEGEKVDDDQILKGVTAIYVAAINGNLEILKFLAENGANIHGRNDVRYSVLHVAAVGGSSQIVKYLVSVGGVPIDDLTFVGNTALHLAAMVGHVDVVKDLLTLNANPKVIDCMDRSSIQLAASEEIVKMIQEDISQKQRFSLHWTVFNQDVESIRNHGQAMIPLIDERDGLGRTALHLAVGTGNEEIVKLLIDSGADVNIPDDIGNIALHSAVERENISIVKILLENRSDVKHLNIFGQNPCQVTRKKEVLHVFKPRRDYKKIFDKLGEFQKAVALGNFEIVRKLLDEKGDYLNEADAKHQQTGLHWAAREGHHEILKLLLEAGTNVNFRNKSGHTALYLAVRYRHPRCVNLLVNGGIGETYENGNTALHVAAAHNCTSVINLLVSQINSKNADEKTPLHLAAEKGNFDVVGSLINAGADTKLLDDDNLNAWFYVSKSIGWSFGCNTTLLACRKYK